MLWPDSTYNLLIIHLCDQSNKYFKCLSNLANFGIGLGEITARHSQIKILTGNGKPPIRHEAIVTGKMISDSLYGIPYHDTALALSYSYAAK